MTTDPKTMKPANKAGFSVLRLLNTWIGTPANELTDPSFGDPHPRRPVNSARVCRNRFLYLRIDRTW